MVKAIRPYICPNSGFTTQLDIWETHVNYIIEAVPGASGETLRLRRWTVLRNESSGEQDEGMVIEPEDQDFLINNVLVQRVTAYDPTRGAIVTSVEKESSSDLSPTSWCPVSVFNLRADHFLTVLRAMKPGARFR